MKPQEIVMRRITVGTAALILLAGVAAAGAQGVGLAPGVNPSNPQDMTFRSNPQDLTVPGGSNRQDMVRRPTSVSPVTSSSRTYGQGQTGKKTKAKQKARPRSTAARP
jgi:hypothetical protein